MSDQHSPSPPIVARGAVSTRGGGLPRGTRGQRPLLAPDSDPDAAVEKILALLSEERFQTARRLAAETVARFPDHARVERAWAIFDTRGKATVGKGGPEPSRSEEFEWLRHPPESARGKWVALVGSEMVGSAETLGELAQSLRSEIFDRTPLVHRID